jgi:hypothetical protein
MAGKAKRKALHIAKMDAKRQRKQSPQYRKMTSSGNAPIKATMAAARSGRNNTVKGYLRADKLRKQEQAVIRQEARNARTTNEQLNYLADRTNRKQSSEEFLRMREVKRLTKKNTPEAVLS